MPTSLLQLFSVIVFISTVLSLTNFGGYAYGLCQDDQKALLLELKDELIFNSSISTKLVDWNQTDDCCRWKGVGCSSGGHVTSLQLDYEGNSGGVENSSSLVSLEYLKRLSLAHNSLEGSIPSLNLSNLVELDLSSNQLKGPISESFFIDLDSLEVLSLSHNFHDLTTLDLSQNLSIAASSINSNWSGFSQLKEFSLASCNLQYFPEFIKQSNLNFLDLSDNQITDNQFDMPIPLDLVSFNFFLIFLSIANNSISGSIPTCICSGESIQVLDMSNNNLSGSIPPCIVERMSSLQMLNLRMNNLSGEIPDRFPTNCGMRILDLNTNNLGGNLPKSLQHCTSLWFVNVARNMIEGSFPCMLPSRLKVLVLRSNKFDGEVPEAIGDLSSIRFLNLSHNALKGRIPRSFGNMAVLEALDLSANQITEAIPVELADLTFLMVLNLSYNQLVGEIPNGLQLQTFAADSFEGNRGLCGYNLNVSCTTWKLSNDAAPWKVEDGVLISLFLTSLAFL